MSGPAHRAELGPAEKVRRVDAHALQLAVVQPQRQQRRPGVCQGRLPRPGSERTLHLAEPLEQRPRRRRRRDGGTCSAGPPDAGAHRPGGQRHQPPRHECHLRGIACEPLGHLAGPLLQERQPPKPHVQVQCVRAGEVDDPESGARSALLAGHQLGGRRRAGFGEGPRRELDPRLPGPRGLRPRPPGRRRRRGGTAAEWHRGAQHVRQQDGRRGPDGDRRRPRRAPHGPRRPARGYVAAPRPHVGGQGARHEAPNHRQGCQRRCRCEVPRELARGAQLHPGAEPAGAGEPAICAPGRGLCDDQGAFRAGARDHRPDCEGAEGACLEPVQQWRQRAGRRPHRRCLAGQRPIGAPRPGPVRPPRQREVPRRGPPLEPGAEAPELVVVPHWPSWHRGAREGLAFE
mmetsp:Transcript_110657/g.352393  ORF Transcript_110657/g.352393 Transcript_110657/m.352393 type:complete len:402 (-) Transcript_110657:1351-2556(-)